MAWTATYKQDTVVEGIGTVTATYTDERTLEVIYTNSMRLELTSLGKAGETDKFVVICKQKLYLKIRSISEYFI